MNNLEAALADLRRRRQVLDHAIGALDEIVNESLGLPTSTASTQIAAILEPKKRGRPPKPKAPAPRVSDRDADRARIAALMDWIGCQAKPFSPAAVPAQIGIQNPNKVLANLVTRKKIAQIVKGTKGHPAIFAPLMTRAKIKTGTDYSVRRPLEPKMLSLMRAIATATDAQFSASQMIDWIGSAEPDLVQSEAQRSDVCVRLIDMASRGELVREGIGTKALYRRGQALLDTARTEQLTVNVPRDKDLES